MPTSPSARSGKARCDLQHAVFSRSIPWPDIVFDQTHGRDPAALYCVDKLPGIEVRAIRGGCRHLSGLDLISYPLELLDTVDNLAEHLAWADFAIGAGNSMVWERACLGVPSINVPLNGHQDLNASNTALAGWAWSMGRDDLMKKAHALLLPLCSENATLSRMSVATASVVDGLGAER